MNLNTFFAGVLAYIVRPEFSWCSRCQRVYRTHRWYGVTGSCPGQECEGTHLDREPWHPSNRPRIIHPNYPEQPEEGAFYPMWAEQSKLPIGSVDFHLKN